MSEIWNDCCDFCVRVDDTKREVEPCNTMTSRCEGDTCTTCKACKDFVPGLEFTSALALAKRRTNPRMRLSSKQPILANQGRLS